MPWIEWSREKLSRTTVQIYLRNQVEFEECRDIIFNMRTEPINLINDMRLKYSNLQLHRQHY